MDVDGGDIFYILSGTISSRWWGICTDGWKTYTSTILGFVQSVSIFDRISHPFRFVVGVNLSLAIIASQGLRVLLRRKYTSIKIGVLSLMPILIWTELQQFSPATLPIPHASSTVSEAYFDMRTDPVPGAVLDLPLSLPNLERAVYVWNQSVHERAIPWGLNDPMPKPLRKNLLTQTLLKLKEPMPKHCQVYCLIWI